MVKRIVAQEKSVLPPEDPSPKKQAAEKAVRRETNSSKQSLRETDGPVHTPRPRAGPNTPPLASEKKNAAEWCDRPRALRSFHRRPLGPPALPPASQSLLSLRSRSEFGAVGWYRGSLVPRSHFAVVVRPGRVVFPTDRRVRMGLISASAPLIEFRRPSGLCPVETGRRPFSQRHLPWASLPYDTCGSRGPVHTGFACPPPSVLRVWSPSRRLTPSRALPALFRASSASGIFPSEPSPPGKSRGRYRRRLPRLPLPASPIIRHRRSVTKT